MSEVHAVWCGPRSCVHATSPGASLISSWKFTVATLIPSTSSPDSILIAHKEYLYFLDRTRISISTRSPRSCIITRTTRNPSRWLKRLPSPRLSCQWRTFSAETRSWLNLRARWHRMAQAVSRVQPSQTALRHQLPPSASHHHSQMASIGSAYSWVRSSSFHFLLSSSYISFSNCD